IHSRHPEELEFFDFRAVELVNDIPGGWSLQLEPEQVASYCSAISARRRAPVNAKVKIFIVALFSLVHQPVGNWGAANVGEFFFGFAEQNAITDDGADR